MSDTPKFSSAAPITVTIAVTVAAALFVAATAARAATRLPDPQTTLSRPAPDAEPLPAHLVSPRRALFPLATSPVGTNGTLALGNIQSETSVAASGSQVVAGFNDFRGAEVTPLASLSGVMYSTDGGETFIDGGQLPAAPGTQVLGDPVLAVYEPPSGPPVFYYSSIFFTASGAVSQCVHRSTDGGASWVGPLEVTSTTSLTDALEDKEWITVDPETGRLFLSWSQFPAAGSTNMKVTFSDDGGTTWSPAATLGTAGQGSVVVCDPHGANVYVAWRSSPASGFRAVRIARSTNNGLTWSASSDLTPSFREVLPPYGFDRFNSFPSMAVNPADGGVELVYAASADGTPTGDFGDIFYRRSIDGGLGFSAPRALNAFPGTDRPQVFPTVSAAANGRIDVFWYDESAGSGVSDLTDIFYTFSTDFGANWSSPVPVTPSPFHNEVGNNYSAPHQGDYIDATSSNPARGCFAWFGEPSPLGSSADAMTAVIPAPSQVAALRVRPGAVAVADVGCGANDGLLVAGEDAHLTIPLQNFGRTALSGIAATLSASTPGVTVHSASGSYATLAPGASAASGAPYLISLAAGNPCGTPARFRLDISASGVAPTYVEFSLPTGVVESSTTLLSENFDGVTPPSLPAGWTTVNGCSTCPPNNWITSLVTPASAPNAVFCLDNPAATTFGRLFGPAVSVPASATYVEVTFDIQYNLEQQNARTAFDAASFGYQLDGVGGTRFATSDAIEFDPRYSHYVVRPSGNSAGDRSGWSGDSGGYRLVRLLIPGLGGHTLTPRFDLTTDENTGTTGVWVDNVAIRALHVGCGTCNPLAVGDPPRAPAFALAGPNPFERGTSLRYEVAARSRVRIEVFSVTGQRVRTLVDRIENPGSYTTAFDLGAAGPRPLGAGVYLARMTAGEERRVLRMVALD